MYVKTYIKSIADKKKRLHNTKKRIGDNKKWSYEEFKKNSQFQFAELSEGTSFQVHVIENCTF